MLCIIRSVCGIRHLIVGAMATAVAKVGAILIVGERF